MPLEFGRSLAWTVPFTLGHENSGYVSEFGEDVEGLSVGDAVAVGSSPSCGHPEDLVSGKHLSLQVGFEKVRGTIDAVMPNKSCFWVWTDDGMGRRMIESCEATALTPLTDHQPVS